INSRRMTTNVIIRFKQRHVMFFM
ncbi:hypothetical protein VCHENC02_3872B, partial [Vibrio harveyi]